MLSGSASEALEVGARWQMPSSEGLTGTRGRGALRRGPRRLTEGRLRRPRCVSAGVAVCLPQAEGFEGASGTPAAPRGAFCGLASHALSSAFSAPEVSHSVEARPTPWTFSGRHTLPSAHRRTCRRRSAPPNAHHSVTSASCPVVHMRTRPLAVVPQVTQLLFLSVR